jgi:hypothetical protein
LTCRWPLCLPWSVLVCRVDCLFVPGCIVPTQWPGIHVAWHPCGRTRRSCGGPTPLLPRS